MERSRVIMPVFYSGFRKIATLVIFLLGNFLLADGLFHYDERFTSAIHANFMQTFNSQDVADDNAEQAPEEIISFPARPMLMSLLLPGLGQFYNKAPWWKTTLFAGIEVAGFVGWWSLNKKADDIQLEYEEFANVHWSVKDWVANSSAMNEYLFDSDTSYSVYTSTHAIMLMDSSGNFMSSAVLTNIGYDPFIHPVRDRDFFENIGKYDQFVGGWDDAYINGVANWIETEKQVGDSTEIILMTDNKSEYLDLRNENNDLLKIAGYATTVIMFNHVLSAIEAVYSAQSNARKRSTDANVGLLFDRRSNYGIGGIEISVRF